ncbi:hypothetical protein [Prosthecomicrobium hirschii]|uniref:hypothetical protein n=1 Tax=Prosthecodimorpha hirschii TaxID=665126 RepID=UPI00221FDCD0|nr:hypothetical protein [Prosthecomicrobium hirschii]MCW1841790.1 hypothetical protein [Prosthecomicrobium hirschii]
MSMHPGDPIFPSRSDRRHGIAESMSSNSAEGGADGPGRKADIGFGRFVDLVFAKRGGNVFDRPDFFLFRSRMPANRLCCGAMKYI